MDRIFPGAKDTEKQDLPHMSLSRIVIHTILIATLLGSVSFADVNQSTSIVDRTHGLISRSVTGAAERLDRFFVIDGHEIEANDSFVRMIGNYQWIDGEGFFFKPRFRLRLRLPGLNQRLSLIAAGTDRERVQQVEDEPDLEFYTGVPYQNNSSNREVAVQ